MCLAAACTSHVLTMPLLTVIKEVGAVLYSRHNADSRFETGLFSVLKCFLSNKTNDGNVVTSQLCNYNSKKGL